MLLHNAALQRMFSLYGKDGTKVTLFEPTRAIMIPKGSFFPTFSGLGTTTTPTEFTKHRIYSDADSKAKLSIINHDGRYQTLIYTTTPENIKLALRNGVFDSATIQDPLAKMIAEIGTYKRKVFERSTELHAQVTSNSERLVVADVAQTLIEVLQPLNRLINNYDRSRKPQENLKNIVATLDGLSLQLAKMIDETKAKNEEPYLTLMACAVTLKKRTEQYRASLAEIKHPSEEQVRAILGSYGTNNNLLKHFLQQQLNLVSQSAIDAGYAVTGLYRDSSGLSQALLDAQFTAENFSSQLLDYHNAISKEHGLDFSDKQKDGLVSIDLGEYGFHPKSNVELAKRVALIERTGKALNNPDDETVRFINFSGRRDAIPGYTAARKVGFTLINFTLDITTFALDLVYAGYAGTVSLINLGLRVFDRPPFKIPPFPSELKLLQKWETDEDMYAHLDSTKNLFGENAVTELTDSGVFVKAARFIGHQLLNFTWKPLVEIVKGVTTNLWDGAKNIYYDITVGTKPIDEEEIANLLTARVKENESASNANHQAIKMLLDMQKPELVAYGQLEFEKTGDAKADYHLNPDKPEDFVSWASNDFMKSMVEVFSHEIYRAHPLGGLAFTLAASTAVPMVMPFVAKFAFLNFIYTKINIPIAKALVGETQGLMSSFSTAMIEGKVAFFLQDLTNGKDSLLVRGVELILENPVLAGLVGTAAIGLGFEIAFKANIPWLSESIASEAGHASFP